MIPPPIVRFLEERANVAFAGTRDAHLVPRGHRVSGWRVASDGRTITALLPESSAQPALDALLHNGRLSVTVEEVGTHETYQLKGRYVTHRAVQAADLELVNRARERFVKAISALYTQPNVGEVLGASIPAPAVAIEMQVEEVFLQTPGPGAGKRIAPPPDAVTSPA